jgi:hypothetical protein
MSSQEALSMNFQGRALVKHETFHGFSAAGVEQVCGASPLGLVVVWNWKPKGWFS